MANDSWKYKELPRASGLVAPSNWDKDVDDWVPYEGDKNIVKELEEIKQQQQEILTRLDEPLLTQVTGSNVEEIVVFDSVVKTEGSVLSSDILDVSDASKLFMSAHNTSDQDVDIYLQDDYYSRSFRNDEEHRSYTVKENGSPILITEDDFVYLKGIYEKIRVNIVSDGTDEGSFTLKIHKLVGGR